MSSTFERLKKNTKEKNLKIFTIKLLFVIESPRIPKNKVISPFISSTLYLFLSLIKSKNDIICLCSFP